MITAKIDFDRLVSFFSSDWINRVFRIYQDSLNDIKGKYNNQYFRFPGVYYGRNKQTGIPKRVNNHFNRLLFAPNYAILDYVIRNKDDMIERKIVDNGSGLGLLSVFCARIGVKVFNFDTFTQIGSTTFIENCNKEFDFSISEVSNLLPNEVDTVFSAGIWIDSDQYNDKAVSLAVIDANHYGKGNAKGWDKELVLVYPGLVKICKVK